MLGCQFGLCCFEVFDVDGFVEFEVNLFVIDF